ncbi:molybdate ABC transporter substrate-binding protein [Halomonas elongata]|uniref:molybdate ABC transporter substrate-binding protein n=1 Tax=Halomonas elongata TaxID=2746 RepID=UPI002E286004|nr:molybdate ABC transporter substrate-binding protein [Halomonas elongata]WVI72690.1 molybdate ABC transporter substrate-binding protein [Halomonas elongata]
MKRRRRRMAAVLLGTLLLTLASSASAGERVELFAAASMTDAIDRAVARFEATHDVDVVPVYAASSTLARQIANGAPAELYISANVEWMDWLGEQGVTLSERADLVHNRLALVAPADTTREPFTPGEGETLAARLGDSERLAVGDPAHVPAGIYARQALQSLGEWEALAPRLARADNVRAALALVERGEAPLGVVYRTDAEASDGVRLLGLFPSDAHEPIIYPIAAIGAHPSEGALTFRRWLESDDAKAIFQRAGFGT